MCCLDTFFAACNSGFAHTHTHTHLYTHTHTHIFGGGSRHASLLILTRPKYTDSPSLRPIRTQIYSTYTQIREYKTVHARRHHNLWPIRNNKLKPVANLTGKYPKIVLPIVGKKFAGLNGETHFILHSNMSKWLQVSASNYLWIQFKFFTYVIAIKFYIILYYTMLC